jgi:hypothetical protein
MEVPYAFYEVGVRILFIWTSGFEELMDRTLYFGK